MTHPEPIHLDSRRRQVLCGAVALVGLASGSAWVSAHGAASAEHRSLPAALSLPAELAGALARQSPLVVMASLDGCPHCRVARQSHLLPMWREGLPIVQVDFRSEQQVIDFEGKKTTHDALIQGWRVTLAPTLLFFGPAGREVAPRMEGSYLADFYRGYLEQRLEQARARL
ncbi:MAG: hypothetical protein QM527_12340 [Alphaproteobacteria bacterium]|nr:hypothetical protein [Alphaproteobacteria bacterium]